MKYEDDSMRFALSYRETGLTYAIIAKVIGVTPSTIRGWNNRYKEKLGVDLEIIERYNKFCNIYKNNDDIDIEQLSSELNVPLDFVKEWYEVLKYKRPVRGGVVAPTEVKERAIELYESGLTCIEVADILKVSKSSVGNWINEVGKSRYKKPERRFDKDIRERAVQMYIDGMRRVDICKELEIPKTVLSQELTKRKISRNVRVKRYSQDIREKAKEMYLSGMTSYEIGDELNVNQASVASWMRTYKISRGKSLSHMGEKNARYNPYKARKYDIGFTRELKERVIAFFGYRCVDCGKTEKYNLARLHVHHVNNDQKDRSIPEDEKMFVSLCNECHSGTTVNNRFEEIRQKYLDIIDNEYNGKCLYTYDEYIEIYGYPSFTGDKLVATAMKNFKKELLELHSSFKNIDNNLENAI